MFENPRRGRQARNFTTNVPKILDLKSSSEQIFFRKLSLGAPELYYNTHPLEERPPWLVTFSIIVFIKSVYIGCCYRARNNRRLNITFTVQGRDGSSRDQFGAIYYVCPLQRADKCFLRSWKTWEVRPFVVSDRQQTAGSNCLSPIFISLIKRNVSRKDLLA